MDISTFTMQKFNEHKTYINILVLESKNINIYQNKEKSIISARTSDLNFKIVKVNEIVRINKEIFYQIEMNDKVNGYFKPEKSIILIPKPDEQAKVRKEVEFGNDLNTFLNIDKDYFEANRQSVAFSKHYAVFDDEVYESIVLFDEIIGFFKLNDISKIYKVACSFKVIKDAVTYYNNEMTSKGKAVSASETIYTSKYIMPVEGRVKFKYKDRTVWIAEELLEINYEIPEYIYNSLDELLIETILNQYQDRLENYHSHYLKVLNDEIKK